MSDRRMAESGLNISEDYIQYSTVLDRRDQNAGRKRTAHYA
jgi:hypothetical protein